MIKIFIDCCNRVLVKGYKCLVVATVLLSGIECCLAQAPGLPLMKDPSFNKNISPYTNKRINPDSTIIINPKFNRTINPFFSSRMNPDSNGSLNPKKNPEFNPHTNVAINPLYTPAVHPFMNKNLKLLFEFNKDNLLIGYIAPANTFVMNCFDLKGDWIGYYVLANGNDTFLQFDLNDQWTGIFLCNNLNEGFNQFDKTMTWTGKHCN